MTSAFFSGEDPLAIERDLLGKGYRLIAGVDEAGRGCLAGPLSVGMVIYSASLIASPPAEVIANIADSKKLTHLKRLRAREIIRLNALAAKAVLVSHKIIDEININRATEFAIGRLLDAIEIKPDVVILDGNFSFQCRVPLISVVKGDARSLTIASASIEAKVTRDLLMDKMDLLYPGYGFGRNKGYGTREHCEALAINGVSRIHRVSYEPVRSMLSGEETLFDHES